MDSSDQQKWQEATAHVLCANNCGFFGSPTTLNLCSKCYKDHHLKQQHLSTAKFAVEKSLTRHSESSPPDSSSSSTAITAAAPISTTEIAVENTITRSTRHSETPSLELSTSSSAVSAATPISPTEISVEKSLTRSTRQSETSSLESFSSSAPAAPISTAEIDVENGLTRVTRQSETSSPDLMIPKVNNADLAIPATGGVVRNRCGSCRKRVGLTGFTCRCGTVFCGVHRYPEKHECSFDFKTVGKEAIARENPVVKAQKLDKI